MDLQIDLTPSKWTVYIQSPLVLRSESLRFKVTFGLLNGLSSKGPKVQRSRVTFGSTVQSPTVTIGSNSLQSSVLQLWNAMPTEIRSAENLNFFKQSGIAQTVNAMLANISPKVIIYLILPGKCSVKISIRVH